MIVLITGGARSGKSTFAESVYQGKSGVVYIATSRVEDDEMRERVNRHRLSRPNYWRTCECTYNLEDAVGPEKYYLLDCITVLVSNIMFDMSKDITAIDKELQNSIEDKAVQVIRKLVDKVRNLNMDLVMVTNEVGCSIVPENQIARVYRDIAGRVNQRIAGMSDEVYAVFCGIPLKLK